MTKGDLISRETAQAKINRLLDKWGYNKEGGEGYMGYEFAHSMDSIPSASILDHAKAIKEYCKNKGNDCTGCPFESKNKNACELGRMMFPSEWFLPEGEKGGE